jgi:hypothetical protein
VAAVRSDSPSPEWYESPDLIDDDEPELEVLADLPTDQLVLRSGVVGRRSLVTNDSDSD